MFRVLGDPAIYTYQRSQALLDRLGFRDAPADDPAQATLASDERLMSRPLPG